MAYADIVLARSNLRAYWKLDETSGTTAADSKNSHDGTYTGGYTLNDATDLPSAMGGGAPRFTAASSGYVASIADHADLDLGDGPFTIVVWFKRASTGAQALLDKANDSNTPYQVGIGSDHKAYLAQSSTAIIRRSSSSITDTTTWHQLVATKYGSTRHIYLDGSLDETSSDADKTLTDSALPLNIGRWQSSTGPASEYFDGWIAHVQIYAEEWSSGDVAQDYTDATTATGFTGRTGPWRRVVTIP
jgi:hypothetical protein